MSDGRLPARRRWIGWVIGTIVTLVIIAIGWVLIRGLGAVNDLQQVTRSTTQMRTAISEGDLAAAGRAAPRIAHHAESAHALTSDPVWRSFEFLPWAGASFTAMREVAELADDVAADAVFPVLDAVATVDLSASAFTGNTIDTASFTAIEEPLADAAGVLSDAEARAARIDAGTAVAPLADAVQQMRDTITEAATVVGALHGASVLLPSMLGSEGPRTYVLAMQNNAELRSSGGVIGAFALVRADHGTISIVRQATTRDLPPLDAPLSLSESTLALFGDAPGRDIQAITSIPDFAEAGAAIAARWQARFGETIDGVIAVDAVAAEHLLEVTGPLSFGPFTVDKDTVTSILLSEVYAEVPDPTAQDLVFEQAAAALFSSALASRDRNALVGAIADSAADDRVRVWSAHEPEETLLAASTLGGTLPHDGARGSYVGVLVNDDTGGKLDYYTRAAISTATGICQGEPTTQVRVRWTNAAPTDAAQALSPSVLTDGREDAVAPGSVRTLIAVYGPEGATVRATDRDGVEEAVQSALVGTRNAVQHTVVLAPGESTTITVSFTGAGAGERPTHVQHTPMITSPAITRGALACDQ